MGGGAAARPCGGCLPRLGGWVGGRAACCWVVGSAWAPCSASWGRGAREGEGG